MLLHALIEMFLLEEKEISLDEMHTVQLSSKRLKVGEAQLLGCLLRMDDQ